MDKFPLEKIDPQTLQERPSSGLNTSHDIIPTALFQPLFSTAKMYQPSRLFQFSKRYETVEISTVPSFE